MQFLLVARICIRVQQIDYNLEAPCEPHLSQSICNIVDMILCSVRSRQKH